MNKRTITDVVVKKVIRSAKFGEEVCCRFACSVYIGGRLIEITSVKKAQIEIRAIPYR